MKKDGVLKTLLSLITYNDKQKPEEFIIPEADDIKAGKSEEKVVKRDDTGGRNGKHTIKKPLTPEELKNGTGKETGKAASTADINNISVELSANTEYIKNKFNYPDNMDIVVREFVTMENYRSFVAYLDGMSDKGLINEFILRPLMIMKAEVKKNNQCILDYVHDYILEINQTKKIFTHKDAIAEILMGNTILYIEGCDFYISCETKGFDKRNVDKPITEGVVKGPQQAFNENLKTNTTLIRRIIKNNSLTTEFLKVGKRSNTMCAVMYIKDLANPAIIKEVKRRLNKIETDFISSAGMLEQLIEDDPYSIIPTVLTTERPDRASSHLLEGKVVILIDGTPFVIVVPVTLHALMHSPEDSALKWQVASAMRLVRFLAIGIAVFLPGFYIAITTFHREMIPTDILIAIAKAKENVPFPSFVELLIMEISFELIREAGIRIPGIIGNTIGIIGALILGQAAVEANLVNPVLIIVIAVTGLGNFAIPSFSLAASIRFIRFPIMLAGALLGFYGISLGAVILLMSLNANKSFGVPSLASVMPQMKHGIDVFLRFPTWMQEKRPYYVSSLDEHRQPGIARQWSLENPNDGGDGRDNE